MKPDGVGNGTPLVYSNDSTGLQYGLLADDAGAAYFLLAAEGVGDAPVAGLELNRLAAAIGDCDRIGPEKYSRCRPTTGRARSVAIR